MNNLQKYTLCFCLLLTASFYSQEQWELVKEDQGIQVYTRLNEVMSFKEFKASMVVTANMNDFLSVLYDVEGLVSWGHNIEEVRLLDRPSDSIQIYYAIAKAPWPYKNRDGIYKNVFSWDKLHEILVVDITMLDKEMDPEKKYVRMAGYGNWTATKMSGTELQIEFQMQVDPGGSIKAWMANMFVTDSPYYTMEGMRKALSKKKYQGKSYELLSN
ncbi:START domain-containing protein [Lutimonas sp.]|uniref:START domain-containing protein n=1 Tax=Lutimonas sp. TaxID=1872403 RepID=UPI003D9B044B